MSDRNKTLKGSLYSVVPTIGHFRKGLPGEIVKSWCQCARGRGAPRKRSVDFQMANFPASKCNVEYTSLCSCQSP